MCFPGHHKQGGKVCEALVRFHAKDGNQFVTHDAVWRPEDEKKCPTVDAFKKNEAGHMNLLFANERAKDKLDAQLTKEDPIPFREYVTPDMAMDLTVEPTIEVEAPAIEEEAPAEEESGGGE